MTWLFWIREEANNPGVNEHYLMMVGAEIRRTRVKKPNDVQLQDMRVDFEYNDLLGNQAENGSQKEYTAEELKEYSDWLKQAMLARWKAKPSENHDI